MADQFYKKFSSTQIKSLLEMCNINITIFLLIII